MVIRKRIIMLQEEKYNLVQDSQNIKQILEYCGLDNEKIENLTPWSIDSIVALLVWCGDGYYEEVWAISDMYCALKSYAYLIHKEGGISASAI